MSESFDAPDKKYVVNYEHKPYSRGFMVSCEFAKEWHKKIYGKVNRHNKPFYRKYNREIKTGFSLMDLYKEKYNNALDELNKALSKTVFFNNI